MKLTEEELRKITLSFISEMGESATPELVKKAVIQAVDKIEGNEESFPKKESPSGKIILTSFGLNRTGVVAAITKALSEAECDIQDLSQKIIGDFFTMIMIVDISASAKNIEEIQKDLNNIAERLNIKIFVQHEDLFRQMHRI